MISPCHPPASRWLACLSTTTLPFFEIHIGSGWRLRAGSTISHRTLTASLIDSRDFLVAKRRAESELLLSAGVRIDLGRPNSVSVNTVSLS